MHCYWHRNRWQIFLTLSKDSLNDAHKENYVLLSRRIYWNRSLAASDLFQCCTLFMFYYFHVAGFSCCTLFMFPFFHIALFFHVTLFSCCSFPVLHYFHVVLYPCFTIFILPVLCCPLFMWHYLRVAHLSCCTAIREIFSGQVFHTKDTRALKVIGYSSTSCIPDSRHFI